MQKTEHHSRLFHLFATGKFFCIITVLLILIASPLRAAEPTMALAVNQPVKKSSVILPVNPASDTNISLFNPKISSINEKPVVLTPIIQIEKQTNSIQLESSLVVRENSGSNKPVTVQAGYGQIWDDKSTLQKICSDHQEPGCAYVSANFSF